MRFAGSRRRFFYENHPICSGFCLLNPERARYSRSPVASTLYDLLPKSGDQKPSNDVLLGRFLDYVQLKPLQLYPAQENAILELFEEKNVILNTPTGSGKSLVASALHFKALAQGCRSVYTCPVKALVNEKWMALCREFGPENVGLSTGDASVNRQAPILCCTAEILANMALREGASATVREVVMDEFHYYSDRDRGVAWQVPLLTLPQTRFLLMSATLGDTAFFEQELTRLNGRETATVSSKTRPVPLEFSYAETPLAQTLQTLVDENKIPVYVVHFTQAEAAESAQDFTSINVCSKVEKSALATALEGFKFNSPYGPDIKRWLRHGIGLHHAGLLPKYRVLVEQLAQKMAELKQQGMEYQQRIEELEKLEHPKPKRDFIYATFNAFADKHPWVGQENIRPKSIVREMFEDFRSFADYIKDYELQRAEGVLLRHLARVHKVMVQTIPEDAKSETVREMEIYLATMIRQVDSSLIEEWERMRDPDYRPPTEQTESRPPGGDAALNDITRDQTRFVGLIRVILFSFLRNLQNRDYELALSELVHGGPPDADCPSPDSLRRSVEEYWSTHGRLCLDPEARNKRHTYVHPSPRAGFLSVQQVLVDSEGKNDWVIEMEVDLEVSKQKRAPALRLCRIGPLV